MGVALVAIGVFFVAFSIIYLARQRSMNNWPSTLMLPILWMNTLVLVTSSVTLEVSRRSLKRRQRRRFNRWLTLTTLLGFFFLSGQVTAWFQLSARGLYLTSNPHSMFFYLLSAAHGVHLLGGLIALLWVTVRTWQSAGSPIAISTFVRANSTKQSGFDFRGRERSVELISLYWHFMAVLWVYLLVVLFIWK